MSSSYSLPTDCSGGKSLQKKNSEKKIHPEKPKEKVSCAVREALCRVGNSQSVRQPGQDGGWWRWQHSSVPFSVAEVNIAQGDHYLRDVFINYRHGLRAGGGLRVGWGGGGASTNDEWWGNSEMNWFLFLRNLLAVAMCNGPICTRVGLFVACGLVVQGGWIVNLVSRRDDWFVVTESVKWFKNLQDF